MIYNIAVLDPSMTEISCMKKKKKNQKKAQIHIAQNHCRCSIPHPNSILRNPFQSFGARNTLPSQSLYSWLAIFPSAPFADKSHTLHRNKFLKLSRILPKAAQNNTYTYTTDLAKPNSSSLLKPIQKCATCSRKSPPSETLMRFQTSSLLYSLNTRY